LTSPLLITFSHRTSLHSNKFNSSY